MTADVRAPARSRRLLGLAMRVAVVVLVLEGAVSLAHVAGAWGQPFVFSELFVRYDPDLGWAGFADTVHRDAYGPGTTHTMNRQGLRGATEYRREVPPERYRIVCLGDSFALGFGVDDRDTIEAQLEMLRPRLQCLNMAQGGYGVDQAYLRYRRDGAAFDADLVLLICIAPMFDRMLADRFIDFGKPVLQVVDDGLVLPSEPVPEDWRQVRGARRWLRAWNQTALGRLVQWMRAGLDAPAPGSPLPYRALAEATLVDLAGTVRARGAELAIALIPLQERAAGRPDDLVAWLAPFAAARGIAFIDLTAAFDALPAWQRRVQYLRDGHLNPLGNRHVATSLLSRLETEFPEIR